VPSYGTITVVAVQLASRRLRGRPVLIAHFDVAFVMAACCHRGMVVCDGLNASRGSIPRTKVHVGDQSFKMSYDQGKILTAFPHLFAHQMFLLMTLKNP
jgi:hypothetical protein